MRTFWIVQAGIGVAAIGASAALGVACSSTVGGPGPGTVTGTETSTRIEPGTEPGTDTATAGPCAYCACGYGSNHSPPGCVDICDNTLDGTTTPDFCNGAPALPTCKACIAQRCGVSDPTQCN